MEENELNSSKIGKSIAINLLAIFIISGIAFLINEIYATEVFLWLFFGSFAIWVIAGIFIDIEMSQEENRAKLVQEIKAEMEKDQAALRNDCEANF